MPPKRLLFLRILYAQSAVISTEMPANLLNCVILIYKLDKDLFHFVFGQFHSRSNYHYGT